MDKYSLFNLTNCIEIQNFLSCFWEKCNYGAILNYSKRLQMFGGVYGKQPSSSIKDQNSKFQGQSSSNDAQGL